MTAGVCRRGNFRSAIVFDLAEEALNRRILFVYTPRTIGYGTVVTAKGG